MNDMEFFSGLVEDTEGDFTARDLRDFTLDEMPSDEYVSYFEAMSKPLYSDPLTKVAKHAAQDVGVSLDSLIALDVFLNAFKDNDSDTIAAIADTAPVTDFSSVWAWGSEVGRKIETARATRTTAANFKEYSIYAAACHLEDNVPVTPKNLARAVALIPQEGTTCKDVTDTLRGVR